MDQKITIVLPVKLLGNYDQNELSRLFACLTSIELFFDKNSLRECWVVSVPSEIPFIRTLFQQCKMNYDWMKIIPETEFIREEMPNYLRHQLVKLDSSRRVSTQYYLILDCDCFFIKKASYNDFFCNGKIKGCWSCKTRESHSDWFDQSNSILQIPRVDTIPFQVTPCLMIAEEVKSLLSTIENKYQIDDYQKILKDPKWKASWTEYSLYFIYLYCKYGEQNHPYMLQPLSMKEVWERQAYEKLENPRAYIEDLFNGKEGEPFLSLIQSSIGEDPRVLVEVMREKTKKK